MTPKPETELLPTPRTDEAKFAWLQGIDGDDPVSENFARELERERAALTARLAERERGFTELVTAYKEQTEGERQKAFNAGCKADGLQRDLEAAETTIATLTAKNTALEKACAQMRDALNGLLEHTYAHECGDGGKFFSTYQRHARNALRSTTAPDYAPKTTKDAWPTDEECEWIVNHLTGRNPRLFDTGEISPKDLTKALIGTWIAQKGSPTSADYIPKAELDEARKREAELRAENDKLTDHMIGLTMIAGDAGLAAKAALQWKGRLGLLENEISSLRQQLEAAQKRVGELKEENARLFHSKNFEDLLNEKALTPAPETTQP